MKTRSRPLAARPAWALLLALILVVPAAAQNGESNDRSGANGEDSAESGATTTKPDDLSIQRISPSCYVATRSDWRSNAGFVVGEEAVLVVDCFDSPEQGERLRREIARITKKPIRYLVQTSEFYDHVVGNQAFPEEVEILASKEAGRTLIERLKKDRMLLAPAPGGVHGSIGFLKVREPSRAVEKTTEIDLGNLTVTLVVAGECRGVGDLVAYVAEEKVLFAGDLAWNKCHPQIVSGWTFQWIQVLAALEKLEIEHVIPGHGEPGDQALLTAQRRYLMALRQTVKHLARREIAIDKILDGVEPAKGFSKYGNQAYWKTNLRYVHSELMRNR